MVQDDTGNLYDLFPTLNMFHLFAPAPLWVPSTRVAISHKFITVRWRKLHYNLTLPPFSILLDFKSIIIGF